MPTNVEGTEFDGSTVCVKHGPGNLEKFVRSRYSSLWIKEDKKINPKKYSAPSKISDLIDSLPGKTFEKMSNSLSDDIDADVVQWLMDHDRVRHMLQDDGLGRVIKKIQIMPGLYEMPGPVKLDKAYKRQGEKGRDRAKEWVVKCKAEGRKVSISGDIWTDGSMSILAIVGYTIRDDWTWSKCVLAVIDFSTDRHLACHIKSKTAEALKEVGIESMHDDVWRKVSDAGSNMKKGWQGFEGGDQTCCDHKLERSTMVYSQNPEIKAMKKRRKELTNHVNTSTVSQMDKKAAEELFDMESTKATRSGATRWRSDHGESKWHRQRGPLLQTLKHCSENKTLAEKCLSATEQLLNDEQESVLDPAARVSLGLEPDTCPTISLALPYIDSIIKRLESTSMKMVGGDTVLATSLHSASQLQRTEVHDDFVRRWDEEMDPDWLRTLQIATFCDPRHKDFDLGALKPASRRKFKKEAISHAKVLYEMDYEQFSKENSKGLEPAAAEAEAVAVDQSVLDEEARKKSQKKSYAVDVGELLGREHESEEEDSDGDVISEWEKYLNLPQVPVSMNLLDWWRDNEHQFPSVAAMAKQVLNCPACSSGVERLFSKAGRNHGKLQQQTKESTMSDILFASNMSENYMCT